MNARPIETGGQVGSAGLSTADGVGLPLASNVFSCIDKNVAVFLDLRQDRYHGADWPLAAQARVRLEALGLVEPDAPSLSASDIALMRERRALLRLRHWRAFVFSCLWASCILSRRRLDIGLASLAGRGARTRRRRLTPFQAAQANEVFERMRPFYPGPRVCLFDSLALARFLLTFGIHTDFVFGVRVRPFGAHCWLERRGAPVNDRTGHAVAFQPIARVRL